MPAARAARSGVRAHDLLEAQPLFGPPAVAWRSVGGAPLHRRVHALARVDGGDRHVAPEDERRAALEERAEGVGAATALAPMLVHQRDVGEQMGGLHGGDDARARRAVEVARVDALEVLDAVRHRRARQPLQQVERPAHGRIADGMHGDGYPVPGGEPHGLDGRVLARHRHAPVAASFVGLEHPRGPAAETAVEEQLDPADAEPA